MKLNTLPATIGLKWIREAFELFKQRPALCCGFQFVNVTGLLMLSISVPWIGTGLASMVNIIFAMTFVLFAQAQSEKQPFLLSTLFSNVIRNKQILLLCVIYAIVTMLTWYIVDLIHTLIAPNLIAQTKKIMQLLETTSSPSLTYADIAILQNYNFLLQISNIVVSVIFFIFFSLAPALCYWNNLSPGKAIFCTFMACTKNIFAFFSFFLLLILVSVAVFIALSLLSALLFLLLGMASLIFIIPLIAIAALALYAITQITIYFAYKDCFFD